MSTINWNKYSYSELQLREAVKSSPSFRQALLKLGIKGVGGGYKVVRRLVKLLNLDTTHFLGQGHLKGKTHVWSTAIPLADVLVVSSHTNTHQLKLRLIKAGLLFEICSECEISQWQGQKLSLHLDHINGVNDDNRLENLRLLCPNCHSLTVTYCGKNKRKKW